MGDATAAGSNHLEALLALSWAGAGEGLRRAWPQPQRMDAAAILTFAAGQRHCVLATVGVAGGPHAIPVAFHLDDRGTFWLPTTAEAVRLRHLALHPSAAVVVGQGIGSYHQLVMAEGGTELCAGDRVPVEVWDNAVAKLGDLTWCGRWIVLNPKRILGYDGSRSGCHSDGSNSLSPG